MKHETSGLRILPFPPVGSVLARERSVTPRMRKASFETFMIGRILVFELGGMLMFEPDEMLMFEIAAGLTATRRVLYKDGRFTTREDQVDYRVVFANSKLSVQWLLELQR